MSDRRTFQKSLDTLCASSLRTDEYYVCLFNFSFSLESRTNGCSCYWHQHSRGAQLYVCMQTYISAAPNAKLNKTYLCVCFLVLHVYICIAVCGSEILHSIFGTALIYRAIDSYECPSIGPFTGSTALFVELF